MNDQTSSKRLQALLLGSILILGVVFRIQFSSREPSQCIRSPQGTCLTHTQLEGLLDRVSSMDGSQLADTQYP